MGNPSAIIIICVVYGIITVLLKHFIEKRSNKFEFDVNKFSLFIHSYFLIASCYILYGIIKYMIWSKYDFKCHHVDLSEEPEVLDVMLLVLRYFIYLVFF